MPGQAWRDHQPAGQPAGFFLVAFPLSLVMAGLFVVMAGLFVVMAGLFVVMAGLFVVMAGLGPAIHDVPSPLIPSRGCPPQGQA
jgi:hypothetical protein